MRATGAGPNKNLFMSCSERPSNSVRSRMVRYRSDTNSAATSDDQDNNAATLAYFNDPIHDWLGDGLDGIEYLTTADIGKACGDSPGRLGQEAGRDFQRKKDYYGKDVKEVVDRGRSHGALEFVLAGNMAERHDGVGYAGPHICTHDDGDGSCNG